jgi:hypothetical protein
MPMGEVAPSSSAKGLLAIVNRQGRLYSRIIAIIVILRQILLVVSSE